jgi:hypothetical protein
MVKVSVQLRGVSKVPSEMAKLKKLGDVRIYVGIQEADNERENVRTKGSETNAQLLYLHSQGSPIRNIPARPVIEPAIDSVVNELRPELRAGGQAWLKGERPRAMQSFRKVGRIARDAARGWFTNPMNNWPPNAPSTVRHKGRDAPLLDTEQMRKAISFVIGGV